MPPPSESVLFWMNTAAAALHAAQAATILIIDKDWTVPIQREYSVWTPENAEYGCFETIPGGGVNRCFQTTAIKEIGRASTKWEIAVFFFLSASFQGAVSMLWTRPKSQGYYLRFIATGVSPLRWAEYALSASLMALIIAQLTGFYSLGSQLLIFGAMAGTMLCGLLHEVLQAVLLAYDSQASAAAPAHYDLQTAPAHRRPKLIYISKEYAGSVRYLAHAVGWVPYMAVWTAIGVRFFDTLGASALSPPWQVYFIIVGLFFGFSGFAATQLLTTHRAVRAGNNAAERLAAYRRGEAMYIVLSLVTKTILCWNLFGGVIMRDGKLFN